MQQGLLVHFLPQAFDIQCALADEYRREQNLYGACDQTAAAATAVTETLAFMAVFGAYADHHIVA